jgi:formylglycine-generating enzyme required for sulfatase activity
LSVNHDDISLMPGKSPLRRVSRDGGGAGGLVHDGSPQSETDRIDDESPQHTVTIGKPFAVGKFTVTFDEWDACVADGGCDVIPPRTTFGGKGRLFALPLEGKVNMMRDHYWNEPAET